MSESLKISDFSSKPWQKLATHMGDPHGDPQTSPKHADPHGLGAFFLRKPYKKSMWIGVLWAGLRVAMWITHLGGKFRHGLLEKSLNFNDSEMLLNSLSRDMLKPFHFHTRLLR